MEDAAAPRLHRKHTNKLAWPGYEASLLGAEELRKNATLPYLVAGRLEKVVNIWIEEMTEEESRLLGDSDPACTANVHGESCN